WELARPDKTSGHAAAQARNARRFTTGSPKPRADLLQVPINVDRKRRGQLEVDRLSVLGVLPAKLDHVAGSGLDEMSSNVKRCEAAATQGASDKQCNDQAVPILSRGFERPSLLGCTVHEGQPEVPETHGVDELGPLVAWPSASLDTRLPGAKPGPIDVRL